jgi:hypothetical protein
LISVKLKKQRDEQDFQSKLSPPPPPPPPLSPPSSSLSEVRSFSNQDLPHKTMATSTLGSIFRKITEVSLTAGEMVELLFPDGKIVPTRIRRISLDSKKEELAIILMIHGAPVVTLLRWLRVKIRRQSISS